MNSDIVVNYKNRKKRILLDYCKILEQIISLEKNSLWNNGKEFSIICRDILESFVDNNYFENNYNRDNPIEYLNACSNAILINIVEYYKKAQINDLNKKSETYLLSLILGTACYVDVVANIVDGDYGLLKRKFNELLNHLKRTNFLQININDKVCINRLNEKVKKNIADEKKFFECFDDLEVHNKYHFINENLDYCLVNFVNNVPNVDKFDRTIVDRLYDLYRDKYLGISYDLLIILLLKENLLNKKVNTYLVQLPNVISNKQLKKLKEPVIRNYIKFLLPLEKFKEKQSVAEKLKSLGFKVIYYYNSNDGKVFEDKNNIEVLCKGEFLDQNKDNITKWNSKGIEFVKTNLGVEITEDSILGKKEA